MFVLAVMGSGVMYLLFGWLLSAIIASLFSAEKGFTERPGLASGLLLPPLGVLAWLLVPPRETSDWQVAGPTQAARVAMVVAAIVGLVALLAGVGVFGIDVNAAVKVLLVLYGVLMIGAAGYALRTAPARAGVAERGAAKA